VASILEPEKDENDFGNITREETEPALWSFLLLLLSSFARVPRFFEDYSTRFGRKKREKKGIIFECEKGQDTLSVYILGTLLLLLLRVERAAPVSENFFLKKKKYARALSFTARSDSVSLSLSASVSVCVSVCVCDRV
jgi:hypothetical protein